MVTRLLRLKLPQIAASVTTPHNGDTPVDGRIKIVRAIPNLDIQAPSDSCSGRDFALVKGRPHQTPDPPFAWRLETFLAEPCEQLVGHHFLGPFALADVLGQPLDSMAPVGLR